MVERGKEEESTTGGCHTDGSAGAKDGGGDWKARLLATCVRLCRGWWCDLVKGA